MNKKLGWMIGALVIVLLAVGAYGATTVYADDSNPLPPIGEQGPGGKRGFGGRGLDGPALDAVAEVLDMSADDLSAALGEGKTLQELAEDAGVDMQQVLDALDEVREEALREHIAQAVEDGNISQEKADWLLEGLEKGFLAGPGFGFGRGGRFGKFGPPTDE